MERLLLAGGQLLLHQRIRAVPTQARGGGGIVTGVYGVLLLLYQRMRDVPTQVGYGFSGDIIATVQPPPPLGLGELRALVWTSC